MEFCEESFPITDVLWREHEGREKAAVGWVAGTLSPGKDGGGGAGTQLVPWALTLAGGLPEAASICPLHLGWRTQPHPSSWRCPSAARSWGLRNKGLGGGSCTHIFTMLARGVGTIPVGTNWPSLELVFLRISLSLGWEENVKWEVWWTWKFKVNTSLFSFCISLFVEIWSWSC